MLSRVRTAGVVLALSLLAVACGDSVFELEVGQCIDLPDGGQVSNVETVECGEAHDAEVYALPQLPDGDFPGASEVQAAANDECLAAFQGYVGTALESSSLTFGFLNPTEDTWEQGDREIVCLLRDPDGGQLTGAKQGSSE